MIDGLKKMQTSKLKAFKSTRSERISPLFALESRIGYYRLPLVFDRPSRAEMPARPFEGAAGLEPADLLDLGRSGTAVKLISRQP